MSRRKVLDLSFAGCGFLTMYHIGALAAFRSASDSVVINRCLGASGGSIVACTTVANLDIVWLEAVFRDLVRSVGSNRFGAFSRNFDVGVILKVWMNNFNLKLLLCFRMCFKTSLQIFIQQWMTDFSFHWQVQSFIISLCPTSNPRRIFVTPWAAPVSFQCFPVTKSQDSETRLILTEAWLIRCQ